MCAGLIAEQIRADEEYRHGVSIKAIDTQDRASGKVKISRARFKADLHRFVGHRHVLS